MEKNYRSTIFFKVTKLLQLELTAKHIRSVLRRIILKKNARNRSYSMGAALVKGIAVVVSALLRQQ